MMIDFNAFFSLVDFGVIIQSLGWIFLAIITFVEKFGPKDKKPWTALFTFIGKILTKDFAESQNKLIERMDSLSVEIKEVARSVDETRAIAARVRILRFGDELLEGRTHSKDTFDQTLLDIDNYERYCKEHAEFKNHVTESTSAFIQEQYRERLRKHDFTR
jgi:hypothetical protein|nr:MAG TPA: hypothetical protein [Caudoviricetes sp.]DAV06506.1 MAG TPA: hypothetical protein [Caudoviricetes sp.]